MIKLLRILAAIMLISLAVPALFADDEFELGMSIMPMPNGDGEASSQVAEDSVYYEEKDLLDEWLIGFHFGYNMGILYATIDSFIIPPFLVEEMTGGDVLDPYTGEIVPQPGIPLPGFLNFIDVGAKLTISKFVFFGEAGINNLYIYRQNELPEEDQDRAGGFGTNLRIGASYKLMDSFSIGLTGTALFPNFKTMGDALKGLFGDEAYSGAKEQIQFMPMVMAVLYL